LSHELEAAQALRESGRRLTPQRLMILSVLRHSGAHMSATEILERVQESYPFVDASTVYRTLAVLKEMRLVTELHLGGAEAVYEWLSEERHHHLICRGCREVRPLANDYLAALGAEILDDYGFRADIDHFAIFGLCDACRQFGGDAQAGDR
jgi:Fur family transcriptional regulator, ferric uptake regulator